MRKQALKKVDEETAKLKTINADWEIKIMSKIGSIIEDDKN